MHNFKSGDRVRIIHPGSHLGRSGTITNSYNDYPRLINQLLGTNIEIVDLVIDGATIGTKKFNYRDIIKI